MNVKFSHMRLYDVSCRIELFALGDSDNWMTKNVTRNNFRESIPKLLSRKPPLGAPLKKVVDFLQYRFLNPSWCVKSRSLRNRSILFPRVFPSKWEPSEKALTLNETPKERRWNRSTLIRMKPFLLRASLNVYEWSPGLLFSKVSSTGVHDPVIEFSVTERFGSIAYFICFLMVYRGFSLLTRKNWRKETYLLTC